MDMQREEGGHRIAIEEVLTMQVQVLVSNQDNIQQKETTVKIMFQNINGLPVSTTHPKNDSIQDTINRLHLDILGVAKVNVAWHKVKGHAWLGGDHPNGLRPIISLKFGTKQMLRQALRRWVG